ncbi:MAG: ATP-binding protein [Anaerolineae bacterium]|nr:ATP-binding protein [Anaerolineae bacterium]
MRNVFNTPTLIVITGFAGTGKSTISTQLSNYYQIPRLEVDALRDVIRASEEFFGDDGNSTGLTKEIIFALAHSFLKCGVSVILDMHMWHSRDWDRLHKLIVESGKIITYKFILHCPYEVCAERVEARHQADPTHFLGKHNIDDYKFKWEALYALEIPDAVLIDATPPPVEVFNEIVKHLGVS